MPARWHARLAHVGIDTITSSAKHEVATSLDIKPSAGTDSPCVSNVGGKLARHTFPERGFDAEDALAVVHIEQCGPFWVAANDSSLGVPREGVHCLRGRQGDRPRLNLPLHTTAERHGGVGDADGGGLGADDAAAHGRPAPLVAPRPASARLGPTLLPGMTPYQLLTGKNPNLSLAHLWGCMVPEQQRGGKLKPKARWGLHLGISEESKGWELFDLTDNGVVTTLNVVFYEMMSLEVVELADEDVEAVRPPSPSPAPLAPPLVADLHGLTPMLASGDEGRSGASLVAPAKSITGGRRDVEPINVGKNSTPTGEQKAEEVQPTCETSAKKPSRGEQRTMKPTKEPSTTGQSAGDPTTGENSAGTPTAVQRAGEGNGADVNAREQSDGTESTDSNMVEVNAEGPGPRRSGRLRRPPEFLTYHACLPPAAFTTLHDNVEDEPLYDDAEDDVDLQKLDPEMHADPEHRWDIATMTVKEALVS
ncbi:unnamed protein product [Closterium sp. NIES-53]